MASAGPFPLAQASPSPEAEDRIKHLPPEAQAAFRRFQTGRDPVELDPILFAILADYMSRPPPTAFEQLPGDTRLIEDLGFDSLAITELVFFTEELFGITISNEEIVQVRSLDELRGFIRRKVAARRGS